MPFKVTPIAWSTGNDGHSNQDVGMASLLDLLKDQLGTGVLAEVSRRLGVDQGQTRQAIAAALPVLLGALARNAARPDGAAALHQAVTRDHDGSALDDVTATMTRGGLGNGNAILSHVLGDRRGPVERAVSKLSGLDLQRVTQLLAVLAPVVLGALGRVQRQHHLDPAGLATTLAGERQGLERAAPRLGDLTALLDADNDGQIADGALDSLKGALGGLLGTR